MNIAIVGMGAIGQKYVEFFSDRSDIKVEAVVDPDETQLGDVPNTINAYSDVSSLLQNHNVGIACIFSPPRFHFNQATEFMNHGTNVLLQKPMVNSVEEAEKLRQIQIKMV